MKTPALQTCAISAVAFVLSFASLQAAPVPWTAGNGNLYEVIAPPNGLTWNAAQADAVARGGHLATILSLPENTFVFGLVATGGFANSGVWLGGFQPPGSVGEPAAGWQWVTGEGPFDNFTNWGGGEPNNVGEEDFIQFRSDGQWNDIGDGARAYVLEIERQPTGVPEGGSAFALLAIALFAVEGMRRKLAVG